MSSTSLIRQSTDDLLPRTVGVLHDVLARPMPLGSKSAMRRLSPPLGARVVYVSTPITTGPAYLDWLVSHRGAPEADRERARQRMVCANVEAVVPLMRALPERFPGAHVVDPTVLEDVPGWEQSDYHRFWTEVIVTTVDEIVFADGWAASVGCSVEFAVAALLGLSARRADFSVMTAVDGVGDLLAMVPKIESVGASAAMQLAVAETLAHGPR